MEVIAEIEFDLKDDPKTMAMRIYKPRRDEESKAWACTLEIDAPFGVVRTAYGESSLQALVHAIKFASIELYASDLYKQGKLGVYGMFGKTLSIPATHAFLDTAPYPF